MPIYIVRWPELTASLVRAGNVEELLSILDQVANSEGCKWSVYRGPLFINFRLPVEWSVRDERPGQPVAPDQLTLGELGPMAHSDPTEAMELSLAEGDDGLDTGKEILRLAFPAIHTAMERLTESEDEAAVEGTLPESDLRAALLAELARFVQVSWRTAHLERKKDKVATLARTMGMPTALVENYLKDAQERQQAEMESEPGDDEE